jgi:superfamily II DNA/RNA helicase
MGAVRRLPRSAADYTHRIGRTGRAGASGVAISFICADSPENAESHFRLIEKRQGQRVPREQLAGFEPQAVATEAQATGGVKSTTRKSKKDKLREAAARSRDGH